MSWLRIKDAARYAGVCPSTFRKWQKDGMAYTRVGNTILYRTADIDAYLEKFTVTENQVDQFVKKAMRGIRA